MQEVQTISLVLLAIFFLLSAIFSGTEAAFLAAQRHRLRNRAEAGSSSAAIAERMKEEPERFLSTLLVGNNLFNTAAAALATTIAVAVVDNSEQAILIATVVMTIALLVISEITPKTIGARHAERVMVFVARPFSVLTLVLTPVAITFSMFAGLVGRATRGNRHTLVDLSELSTLVRTGVEEGTVEEREAQLVQKVFEFGDHMVREIMTPRTEIVWVRNGTTLAEFLDVYAQHTPFPFPHCGGGPRRRRGHSVHQDGPPEARDGTADYEQLRDG